MEFINDPNYLKIESVRLDTFHTWPLNCAVSREEVARQGFYYTGHNDAVACVFCRGHLEKWCQNDVVSIEHSKWFPDCPFVQGRDCGNVPRQNTNPRIPAYTYFYDRLDSFVTASSWATTMDNISPDKMASAGFFYIGPSDRVQCFNCGLKLDQWEATDNPWDEHKKYKWNQCSFVMERYNCYLSRRMFTGCTILHQDALSRRLPDDSFNLFQQKSLAHFSESKSKEVSKPYSSSLEESQSTSSSNLHDHHPLPPSPPSHTYSSSLPHMPYMEPTTSRTHENISLPREQFEVLACAPVAAQLGVVQDHHINNAESLMPSVLCSKKESETSLSIQTAIEIEDLRQKLAKLENEVYCKICFENEIEIVFKPCKHMVCCIKCSRSQVHCPICRAKIEEKERIYRS